MDIDTTPPFAPRPPDPAPAPSSRRWPRRVGVVAGIAALSAAAIGFGTAAARTDAGSDDLGPVVTIDGEDGLTLGSFGDEAGTITVAKAADGSVSIDTSGSATVSDDPAGEEEWFLPGEEECGHLTLEELDA